MDELDPNAELQEAKEKLEALEQQIEGLQAGVGTALVQISQKGDGETHFGGEVSNIIHFIESNEMPLGCEFITDTVDARIAFAVVANSRANTAKPIMHGDFLVLRCNDDPVDPTTGVQNPVANCFYIGLCVEDSALDQATPADDNFTKTAAATGDFYPRHFVAWKTCGGGDTEGHTGQVIVETGTTVTKTESSPDANGCRDITIQIQTDRTGLNFVDGLLTGNPAITSESADIETFTFKAGCGNLCPSDAYSDSYTITVVNHPTSSSNGNITISRPTSGSCTTWSGSNGNAANANDPLSDVTLTISGTGFTLSLPGQSVKNGAAGQLETAAIANATVGFGYSNFNLVISP